MPVAKTYVALTIEEGPYIINGRQYCKVKQKNGTLKQVRWYTDNEYKRMYPNEPNNNKTFKNQKEVLGFKEGYITIFKGDIEKADYWFKKSHARYCRFWGWYIISTEEIPLDMPDCVEPIVLYWDKVGTETGELRPEKEVTAAIEDLIYEDTSSQFIGTVGDKISINLTVVNNISIETQYGKSNMHIMKDKDNNTFVWLTSAKDWPIGTNKTISGTIKEHRTYHKDKQTVLTRCFER